MAQPRFQLRVVRRRPKQETTDRRLVADARASGLDDRIVWRLLGANNRELGRSGAQFGSVDECLGGIARLRAVLHGGQPVAPSLASTDHGGLAWWWTVRAGDEVLASAVRAFSRQIECLKNFETFSHSALSAQVPDDQSVAATPVYAMSSDRKCMS